MRLGAWMLVLGLLAGCAGEAAKEDMTGTTMRRVEPTATTTLVVGPTATIAGEATTVATEAEGPVDICPRGRVWEPGETYVAECFVVPVSFIVAEEGFASEGAGGDWLTVRWRDPGDPDFVVRVGMISYRSTESPESVLEAITARKGIDGMSEPSMTTVAGIAAFVIDVEGLPREGLTERDQDLECNADGVVRFVAGGGGNPIVEGVGRADAIGVSYCDVARVWAVQVGEQTVTFIGGSADPARHDEAVAKIEELFEGMSFEFP